jgi:hypothetical protein
MVLSINIHENILKKDFCFSSLIHIIIRKIKEVKRGSININFVEILYEKTKNSTNLDSIFW